MATSTRYDQEKKNLQEMYERSSVSQLEIAKQESVVWDLFKSLLTADRKTAPRREIYFKDTFGDGYRPGVRLNLLSLREWSTFYWDKIDRGLALMAGYRLAKEAKKLGMDEGLTYKDACERVWKRYTDEGKPSTNSRISGSFYKKKPKVAADEFADSKNFDPDVKNSKRFRSYLRTLTKNFVYARLEGVDESIRSEVTRDFEYDIRVAYEDLLRRIYKLRKEFQFDVADMISNDDVRQACECLDVPVPSPGDPVDVLVARPRFKKLAGQFHPDRHKGDDRFVRQYNAVVEAWDIIQEYNRGLKTDGN